MSIWKLIFLSRGYLISVPLIFSIFCFHSEVENEYIIVPFGLAFFFTGFIIRIWAQQHLKYRLKIHKNLTLTGPYQYVRNPIYIGNIFIFLGMTFLSELLWLLPITLVWSSIVYSYVVHYEEIHLLKKYGNDYQNFLNNVPRWVPRIQSFKKLSIINEYFTASVIAELYCLLYLAPYILKEAAPFLFEF